MVSGIKSNNAIYINFKGGEADYITYPFDPLMYEKYLGQYFNQMKNIDDFVFDLFDVKKIVNFEE